MYKKCKKMKQLTVEKIENRAKDIIAARSKIY
jgi:hypothetical protein